MITTSNSLSVEKERGRPINGNGDLLHTMAGYELPRVRTELQYLLIGPSLMPHPEQTDTEFVRQEARGSLVPQSLYGIQSRCLDGGIHAKEEANAHGDAHSKHDRPKRNR